MGEIRVSTFVAGSQQEVFEYLHQPDHMKKWMAGFVRSEPSTDGPATVGLKATDIFEEGGRTIEMETEITEFDAPRLIATSIEADQVAMASRVELEATDGGTTVTQTATAMWKMPYRLLGPAMTATTRKRMAEDLDRLAALFGSDG